MSSTSHQDVWGTVFPEQSPEHRNWVQMLARPKMINIQAWGEWGTHSGCKILGSTKQLTNQDQNILMSVKKKEKQTKLMQKNP